MGLARWEQSWLCVNFVPVALLLVSLCHILDECAQAEASVYFFAGAQDQSRLPTEGEEKPQQKPSTFSISSILSRSLEQEHSSGGGSPPFWRALV